MAGAVGGNYPVRPVQPERNVPRQPGTGSGPGFDAILQRKMDSAREVKFSAHAQQRLQAANISLNGEQLGRLHDAVERAAAKGARESLVLMDELAMVVSVSNRTVITAVDSERVKENVFTNIDSAVIT